jgi:hypothetical protein
MDALPMKFSEFLTEHKHNIFLDEQFETTAGLFKTTTYPVYDDLKKCAIDNKWSSSTFNKIKSLKITNESLNFLEQKQSFPRETYNNFHFSDYAVFVNATLKRSRLSDKFVISDYAPMVLKIAGTAFEYMPNLLSDKKFRVMKSESNILNQLSSLDDNISFFIKPAEVSKDDPMDRVRSFYAWILYL